MANEAELMIIICLVYGIQKGCFTRKDLVNKIYIVHSSQDILDTTDNFVGTPR